MRRTRMLFALAGCVALASGCAAVPLPYTEIGYVNTVTLQLHGTGAAAVGDLEWCVAGECVNGSPAEARGLGAGQWEVQTFTRTPDEITVIALDAAGREISRVDVAVPWTMTDSPNGPGCDNASDAPTVTVPLS